MQTKTTGFFSAPLMKQDIKSNWALVVLIMAVMIMMSTVLNYSMSIMGTSGRTADLSDDQNAFYTYLGGLEAFDRMSGAQLSYGDFIQAGDKTAYTTAFALLNQQMGGNFSVDGFQSVIDRLKTGDVSLDTYVRQFEYNDALMQSRGCFTGESLTTQGMLTTTFAIMGIDSDRVEKMASMDSTAMINQMYYTVMGLLPIFLLIVILGNSVIASQVDKGSMAYVLSTPTKRSAVTGTQMVFMVVAPLVVLIPVCLSRIVTTGWFFGTVNGASIAALYGGMYVLVEAVAGICYMGSCLFNRSRGAMAFGGGLTVWFFLASMLGMFGSSTMTDLGMGVKELGVFNHLTLVGLYDIKALATVGTGSVDWSFLWKLGVLAAIAILCYAAGAVRFQRKDLPL